VHEKLYEISGHLENFAQNMFGPLEVEGQRFRLKPMNCPGHILIYKEPACTQLSRAAAALLRVRHGLSLRALGRAARPHARARLHARRRPPLLHARSAAGEFEQTLDEALR
jgi:hypothetical protein